MECIRHLVLLVSISGGALDDCAFAIICAIISYEMLDSTILRTAELRSSLSSQL